MVADTSGLLAAFDENDQVHEAAARVVDTRTLLISPLVLTELDYLTRRERGFGFATAVLETMLSRFKSGFYSLAKVDVDDFETAYEVRGEYAGLELDLADTIGVALAHRYGTNEIFTLDQRDFRAIKPLTAGFDAFKILPYDVD
ncbi:type II toxin-antitoxin system VapC family toxin [Glycomyces tenuis]|uniref:type II toxin-antitoxin system VapC family toxin n=1 Tax=Glycomyces tenuis TaxID=58116 RepID=UPI001B7FC9C8|nr:PIN domain-containing protein [Glycomyces tenuis]